MVVISFIGAVFLAAQFTTTLEAGTVAAFDKYFQKIDATMAARAASANPFAGKVPGVTSYAEGKEAGNGMIHDWEAIEFIPGGKKDAVIAVLRDIPKHPSVYSDVAEGRLEQGPNGSTIAIHRIKKKKVLEINLEMRYSVTPLPGPLDRYATRSIATEIVEIHDAGKPSEMRLPPGQDHGFLWRQNTFWILQETSEGLWMECRSVSLTRDTPFGLGWAIRPIVRDLPKEALQSLMSATKKAAFGL